MLTRSVSSKLLEMMCIAALTKLRSCCAASSGRLFTERKNLRTLIGVRGHLPGDVRLHEHAQSVARADVLKAGRGRAQAEVDRDRALERHRQLPGEAGLRDDAIRIAEARDDGRRAGRNHHDAGGRDGGEQHETRDAEAQVETNVLVVIVIVGIVRAVV